MSDLRQPHKTLDLLDRYRLVAPRLLRPSTRVRVERELKQLEHQRLVSRWKHASGLSYWTRPNRRPLSNQTVARAYGYLAYCPPWGRRPLLTAGEATRLLRALGCASTAAGYYLDRWADEPLLGLLRVDTGSPINRLIATSTKAIDRLQGPGTRQLVDNGRFEVTWLVATNAKQRRLEQSLRPLEASGVRFVVAAMPDLLDLLAPRPAG